MNLPAHNAPVIITIAHLGGNKFSVQYDNAPPEQLTWDEMLGQVACLTAHADVSRVRDHGRQPLIITLVNQGWDGWRMVVDGDTESATRPFDDVLARIVGLTFPPHKKPGEALFKPQQLSRVTPAQGTEGDGA